MKVMERVEIKNFNDLRERVKQLVKTQKDPLHPEAEKMIHDFMPEIDLQDTEKNEGDR